MTTTTTTTKKTAAKPVAAGSKAAKATTKPAAKVATKQATKPVQKATAKATAKPAQKAASKPTTALGLAAVIVKGIAARIEAGSPFYKSATAYHTKAKTSFPRPRTEAARAGLDAAKVTAVFKMHDDRVLSPANADGQAMYDIYRTHVKA